MVLTFLTFAARRRVDRMLRVPGKMLPAIVT